MLPKLILTLSIFTISLNVCAEQWDSIVESETGAVYFYDPTTVKREANTVKYWELVNFKNPLKAGNIVVYSSKTHILADCDGGRYQNLKIVDYEFIFGKGRIVDLDLTGSSSWYQIKEGSVNAAIQNKLCKNS